MCIADDTKPNWDYDKNGYPAVGVPVLFMFTLPTNSSIKCSAYIFTKKMTLPPLAEVSPKEAFIS